MLMYKKKTLHINAIQEVSFQINLEINDIKKGLCSPFFIATSDRLKKIVKIIKYIK